MVTILFGIKLLMILTIAFVRMEASVFLSENAFPNNSVLFGNNSLCLYLNYLSQY